MNTSYPKALNFVLESEGGYSDDIGDSGGPTEHGLTWRDIAAHRGIALHTVQTHAQEVALAKSLTSQELADIYKGYYWDTVHGDALPWPLDMIAFDDGVNCGTGTAARHLCESVGLPPATSVSAELLQTLSNEGTHLPVVTEKLLGLREAYYHAIAHGHNARFLKGWLNRMAHLRQAIKTTPATKTEGS